MTAFAHLLARLHGGEVIAAGRVARAVPEQRTLLRVVIVHVPLLPHAHSALLLVATLPRVQTRACNRFQIIF